MYLAGKKDQIHSLVGWWTPDYRSRWKDRDLDGNRTTSLLIIWILIFNPHLSDPNNPWITNLLKIWKERIKIYHLKGRSDIFQWFAYNEDFTPCKHDSRFRNWYLSSLMAYCHFETKVQSWVSSTSRTIFILIIKTSLDIYKSETISARNFQKLKLYLNKWSLEFSGQPIKMLLTEKSDLQIIVWLR